MRILWPLALLLCSAPRPALAADSPTPPPKLRGPPTMLWVRLQSAADQAQARRLGLGFVEEQQGDWWRLDGPPGIEADLDAAGLSWRRVARSAPVDTEGYHDSESVLSVLDDLVDAEPELVQRVDLGWSVDGRPLRGVRLSTTATPRAQWRLVGAHHGDEWSSSEVALDAAQRLVTAWRDDPDVAALLDRDAVWVIPQINPDGVEAGTRYNSNDTDLNRNYDYQWSSTVWASGDQPFSEPETRAVRALHSWVPATAALSFHAGAANIGWVWNYDTTPTADDSLLQDLAQRYADACTVPDFWTTNGADWYITHGDTNDWAYGRLGVLDFTVEVSVSKTPPASTLPSLRDQHWPGVRAFLLADGVAAGQVVDANTGQGVPAVLTPLDLGWPLLTGPDGHFGRLLEGPQVVRVESAGFASTELTLTPDQDRTISLDRDGLLALRPDPPRLASGGSQFFTLSVDAHTVTLARPGHDDQRATPDADGWTVDTTGMEPGPWDLVVDDAVSPRSIFLAEVDDAVTVTSHTLTATSLTLSGSGFGQGTAGWALSGDARAPVPLPLTWVSDSSLELDLSEIEDGGADLSSTLVDVVLLSNGRQIAAIDVTDILDEDDASGPWPTDTGTDSGADSGTDAGSSGSDTGKDGPTAPAGCGCASAPGTPSHILFFLFILLPYLSRRKRP
ncbi:MAG: hypothetical protein GXP62_11495 [Oligoflexia bacterium]|nr:hypothetical protein [Oligoflexia bacterium]